MKQVLIVAGCILGALLVIGALVPATPPQAAPVETYGVDCSQLTPGECFKAREDIRARQEFVKRLEKEGAWDRLDAAQRDAGRQ